MLLCADNSDAHWIMNQVGKWCGSVVSKMLVEITSQGSPAKLKVRVYSRFPSMAVSWKIYDVAESSQCCSLVAVSLAVQQSISLLHCYILLYFICQWSHLLAQDQASKHFPSQRAANHHCLGISFIFPSSACKTRKHVVQIRSKLSRPTETGTVNVWLRLSEGTHSWGYDTFKEEGIDDNLTEGYCFKMVHVYSLQLVQ